MNFAERDTRRMAGPRYTDHKYLREWRKRRGLTLAQVAELIGSKTNTISGWETGNRAVDLDDLRRLANAYGVHPAKLLFSPDETEAIQALSLGGDEMRLLRMAAEIIRTVGPDSAEQWLKASRSLTDASKPDPGEAAILADQPPK